MSALNDVDSLLAVCSHCLIKFSTLYFKETWTNRKTLKVWKIQYGDSIPDDHHLADVQPDIKEKKKNLKTQEDYFNVVVGQSAPTR